MAKRVVTLTEFKNCFLSRGNIFWQKKSGDEILISAKGDLLNLDLMEKISKYNQILLIDDEVDPHMLNEADVLIEAYKNELIFKNKMKLKQKMMEFLFKNFVTDKKSQFELNIVFWRWFSNIDRVKAITFVEKNKNLFSRCFNLATGNTFIAFCLNYYDVNFLENIFNQTFECYENMIEKENVFTVYEKLDLYQQKKIGIKDIDYLINSASLPLFETKDGEGYLGTVENELNEFERVVCELNTNISFTNTFEENIINLIIENKVKINTYVCEIIKVEISKKNNEIAA